MSGGEKKPGNWKPVFGGILLIVVLFIAIKLVFWGLGEIIRSNHPEVYQSASVSQDASASGSGEGEDAPSFCVHCGKALPDSFQWGQFCPYCGEKVES